MTLFTSSVAGVAVAAATATVGDLSLAIVTAVGGVAVVIAGPIVSNMLRNRTQRKPPIDHRGELIAEQAEFIEFLRAELVDARGEIQDLTNELKRMRRGRG